jgi:hypothetical protein
MKDNRNLIIAILILVIIGLVFYVYTRPKPIDISPYEKKISTLDSLNSGLQQSNLSLQYYYDSLEGVKQKVITKYVTTYIYIDSASITELDSIIRSESGIPLLH